MVDLVFVGAIVAERAVAFAKGLAYWTVRVETESVFSSEEVGEGKVEE